MDYRDILERYIEHVGQSEGVDFLSDVDRGYAGALNHCEVEFTDKEWAELQGLRAPHLRPDRGDTPTP